MTRLVSPFTLNNGVANVRAFPEIALMAIHFYCPLGHRLVVPDDRADKKGRCPVCQQKVIAPVPDPRPSGRSKRASPLKRKRDDGNEGEVDMIEQLAAEMLRKPGATPDDDKLSVDD